MRLQLPIAALALAAVACAPSVSDDVDDATARQVLDETADLAERGMTSEVCASAVDVDACTGAVRDAGGPDAVPDEAPSVVCTFHAPATHGELGGQVLVVRGRDGLDRPYTSDFVVYRRRGRAVAVHGAYWTGAEFTTTRPDECPRPGVERSPRSVRM